MPLTRKRHRSGYWLVWVRGLGWVYEHRWLMEQHLGRGLRDGEEVHHKNGCKDDNQFDNLELCESRKAHSQHHLRHDHERIAGLYATGRSTREVARAVGCGVTTVHSVVKERGLLRTREQAARLRSRDATGRFG